MLIALKLEVGFIIGASISKVIIKSYRYDLSTRLKKKKKRIVK